VDVDTQVPRLIRMARKTCFFMVLLIANPSHGENLKNF